MKGSSLSNGHKVRAGRAQHVTPPAMNVGALSEESQRHELLCFFFLNHDEYLGWCRRAYVGCRLSRLNRARGRARLISPVGGFGTPILRGGSHR